MSFRNWLLTGTSLTILALAPVSVVRAHLEDVTRVLPAARTAKRLVGVAGTVTSVAAV